MPAKPPILVDLKFDPDTVARILKTAFADRGSINLADPANKDRDLTGIDYALLWKPDPDLFNRAPNLKVIFSGGAGVDSFMNLPGLPDVPIVRFSDRSLTTRMSEWLIPAETRRTCEMPTQFVLSFFLHLACLRVLRDEQVNFSVSSVISVTQLACKNVRDANR